MNKKIIIKKSQIDRANGLFRVTTDVIEDGFTHHLFYEVEEEYAKYCVHEFSDALLYLCLPVALRCGYDIESEMPSSSEFLFNIQEVLIPNLLAYDNSLKNISINIDPVSYNFNATGVGTAISCGVDSFYTIMKHKDNYINDYN